jgi:hypothetical protein
VSCTRFAKRALSVFAGKNFRQDILVAGDLNVLHGYGENGDTYWAARYETVFSRLAALNFKFVGPQAPNGRRAEPWPKRAAEVRPAEVRRALKELRHA